MPLLFFQSALKAEGLGQEKETGAELPLAWTWEICHIDYNAPCLTLKILHTHCLRFLLGRL